MRKFRDAIRENPATNIHSLRAIIIKQLGVEVLDQTLWRAKRMALYQLKKDHTKSFTLLRKYTIKVEETNPGSMVSIKKVENNSGEIPTFKGIFISYWTEKLEFKNGCGPFIGVDGCHLRGAYGGIMLSVVSVDTNSSFLPIAVVVVEKENKWAWVCLLEFVLD